MNAEDYYQFRKLDEHLRIDPEWIKENYDTIVRMKYSEAREKWPHETFVLATRRYAGLSNFKSELLSNPQPHYLDIK